MNRLSTRIFLLTFAIIVAGLFVIKDRYADIASIKAQSVVSNSNLAPPNEQVVDDFVPEFVDLPSFDELSNGLRNADRLRNKLIDVGEFMTAENPWPSYSRSELELRSGETWLGLYATQGKMRLVETKVSRLPRRGYIGPGDQLYDWLEYERKGELIFLAKGIRRLRPGDVTTLFRTQNADDRVSLDIGFRQTFELADKTYVLRVTTGLQRDGGKVNVLVIESEGRSQIVTFSLYYKDHNTLYNSIGELLWAGDIDRDGRLDLYFSDFGYEKGGFGSNLYLSSPASGERLVEYVAGFSSAGC